MALNRLKTLAVGVVGVGGFDHAAANARQHVLQGSGLATPPARNGGQLKFFAQQVTRQCRHETQQRIRLQKTRARGVGHQHVAAAHHLQQAGHAQGGVGAHLQGVKPVVVHPLEQAMHGLQTLQGFQIKLFITHGQVIALHQAQTQIPRQIGVLEIGFVVRPGGEQRDVRQSPERAAGLDAVDQRAVSFGQTAHRKSIKGLRKQARNNLPIFKQITQTRRRLCALRQQPPATVRPTSQVKCSQRQIAPTDGGHTVHGRQIGWVALHQSCRQLAAE